MNVPQARWRVPALITAAAAAAAGCLLYLPDSGWLPHGLPIPAWLAPALTVVAAAGLALLARQLAAVRRQPSSGTGAQPAAHEQAQTPTPPDKPAPQDDPPRAAPWWRALSDFTDLLVVLDAQGRIQAASSGTAQSLGRAEADIIGTSMLEYLPPPAVSSWVAAFKVARGQPGERPGAASSLQPVRLTVRDGPDAGNASGDGGESPDHAPHRTAPLSLQLQNLGDGTVLVTGRRVETNDQPATLIATQGAEDDRFSRIFHGSPDAIAILTGSDGTLVDFNPGFTRMLGYRREEAIGATDIDLNLWPDPADRMRILRDLRRRPDGLSLEISLRAADGTLKPVEMSLRFMELDGDLHLLCIARDISQRISAESAARTSEQKFSEVFSQSPDGIVILKQKDLVIIDANTAFCMASGYSKSELVGHAVQEFDAFVQPGALATAAAALTEAGKLRNSDIVLRNKSGRQIPALLSATLVELEGEPCILCIAKDVSELREAQGRLQESEQRFRGAFENAPIGIVLLDTRGYIFEANRFATDLLDYDEDALNGLHISRLLPPEERGSLKAQLEALTNGREITSYDERRMVCASGLEIWTNCHMVMQRDPSGEPSYCILQIADVTEMKQNQRRMERLAFFDTLTDLANRRLFNDRLRQAIEHSQRARRRAALLYLDLDQFKRVNDTLGHDAGDELLQEVARRLLQCVRKEDTVGRPGGDEFTILLYDISSPTDAGHVAEKILGALRQPMIISGHQLVITTSIGIATVPDDGVDPNMVLKNADLAMYRAKEQGRNNFQFYSEELNANAVKRLRTEYELRRALERSEFELYYQPKVRLTDRALVGVESLIRWQHPERGLVTPDGFISIAEETGDIVEIGAWVIQETCAAGSRMVAHHGQPLSIGVNISPRQFRDPNLVATVRQALKQACLQPACLELEITETMLMHDVEAASETVHRLHELGVRLAIDDFGTGYSSLNHLKKFPIDTVKVDRTFIMDIPESADDKAITAAVIAMAHRLNMTVVAEGVETQAQLDFLLANGCEYGQGYLFGRAMPLREIRPLLAPRGPRSAARAAPRVADHSRNAKLNHGT